MTRDAFVSYARPDSRATLLVCAGLQALGIRLWLDTEELRRSRASWREAAHAGIAVSRNLLVALSADWVASPACRYELAIALERRTPIIAVELQPADAQARSLLPDHAEVIDRADGVRAAIEVVGARL